jgi:hypothetical protein
MNPTTLPTPDMSDWIAQQAGALANTMIGYISAAAPAVFTLAAMILGIVAIIALVRMAIAKL